MQTLHWDSFETGFGEMLAIAGDKGLRVLMRCDSRNAGDYSMDGLEQVPGSFEKLRGELAEYCAGELREFSIELDLQGTQFQRSVWQRVAAVPFGETRTYLEIAEELGNVGAVRAVGHANGCNPVHILIPCHRIIAADGSLRGYAGGLEMKRKLLELEGHDFGGRQSLMFG